MNSIFRCASISLFKPVGNLPLKAIQTCKYVLTRICHTWIERGLVSSQYHSPQHYNPFLVYNFKYLYLLEIYCFAGQHHTLCVDFTRNELYLAKKITIVDIFHACYKYAAIICLCCSMKFFVDVIPPRHDYSKLSWEDLDTQLYLPDCSVLCHR